MWAGMCLGVIMITFNDLMFLNYGCRRFSFLGWHHDHVFVQVQSLEEGLDEFQARANPEFPALGGLSIL